MSVLCTLLGAQERGATEDETAVEERKEGETEVSTVSYIRAAT